MDSQTWNERLNLIDSEFYADFDKTLKCGPFDGGCVIVAQALKQAFGGEIVVLVNEEGVADHAVLLRDDMLWDYDGPLEPKKFIARFNDLEIPYSPAADYRPIQEGDLDEAYRDDELAARLSILFKKAAPELIPPSEEAMSADPAATLC